MARIAGLALLLLAFSAPARADATAPAPLAKARMDAAEKVYTQVETGFSGGMTPLDTVYLWSVRWYESARAAGVKTAAADHLKRMQALETKVKTFVSSGMARAADNLAAGYYRAEAEVWAAAK
jgi:hypothetical protein